jgi:hypothetical protein
MKHSAKSLMCALSGVILGAAVDAAVADLPSNPYQGIVDRNLFGLKPLPPPASTTPDPPPAPKITLTGITTILGKKQVLMKLQPPAKPPEQPKEQSLILAEGERDGEIEVVSVDMQTGTVKLNDYGTPLTLNLEKDGAKLPSTPAPVGQPGAPGAVGAAPNPFQPAVGGLPQGGPGMKSLPTRTLRLPPAPGAGSGAPGADAGNMGTPYYASGGLTGAVPQPQSINTTLGGTTQPTGTKNWPPEVPMSTEEQTILIEAQREANKNNPNFPPLPPTAISPAPTTQSNPRTTVPNRPPPLPQ